MTLLTGSQPAARAARRCLAASGAPGIVIGTHALLAEQVQFADLGLVVIDEQHRFGVEQRDALRGKAHGARPHVLVMTATPIPRTVAMTVYGDLDVSTLAELPGGRSPIATHVVPAAEKPAFLERAWQRVREEAARAARPTWSARGSAAATTTATATTSPDRRIHRRPDGRATRRRGPEPGGRRWPCLTWRPSWGGPAGRAAAGRHARAAAPDEKDRAMSAFAAGELDVLVSTTVIEVGVDVPNATVMVIMDAERFGVSQLHQLRGRVGRGATPGLCLLVTEAPADSPARERLDAVAATCDGFRLSRLDLEQRREGDVLGSAQAGAEAA